ncbi:hypothetical protein N0V84_010838 [Fusarium piperis]|uniref:Conidiation-specific protein 6 n=1 Tax=Fusarium piperis TaxID=1435070 RepID=A0A9W8TCA1_9HYPO|nr:hypothetical protein N0V84_010838 [Fusarium piperis]
MTDAQIAGGHKATINNPNTSQEAKEHSKKVLEEEFNGGDGKDPHLQTVKPDLTCTSVPKAGDTKEKNPGNVAGGLKSTLSNPNASEEAKESAKERLNKMGE